MIINSNISPSSVTMVAIIIVTKMGTLVTMMRESLK